jgi:uncharacterized protein YqiB (DUF1249 family)
MKILVKKNQQENATKFRARVEALDKKSKEMQKQKDEKRQLNKDVGQWTKYKKIEKI